PGRPPVPGGGVTGRGRGAAGRGAGAGAAPPPPAPRGVPPPRRDLSGGDPLDVIVCFVTWRADLEEQLATLRGRMAPAAGLWVAWPKRASRMPTDMTEDVIREIALPTGLVDNKVCAIDEVWSGLRLVIRRELRPPAV